MWETPNPIGTIVVTHGLAEHSDCYHRFAEKLNSHNWNVVAWDMRGHGRSEGKRGFVKHFDLYVEDLHALMNMVRKDLHKNSGPIVMFAHSMGGLVNLKSLILYGDEGAKAICLSSPELGIAMPVPPIKEKFAKLVGEYLPKITFHNEISYSALS